LTFKEPFILNTLTLYPMGVFCIPHHGDG